MNSNYGQRFPDCKRVRDLQRLINEARSSSLNLSQKLYELRELRHTQILEFTKEFLEKPNKSWRGRLLYDILWRTAEKL